MISRIFLVVFAACVAVNAELTKNDFGNLPLRFEPALDKSSPAKFLARGKGYTLFLTDTGAILQSPSAAIRLKIVGANPSATITPQQPLPGATNYLIGNDPSKWRTSVTGFARVEYRGIYPGIDLVYYGKEGHLEYDFVLAPKADPRKIQIAFDGAVSLAIDKNGDLIVSASGQALRFRKPVLYQIIDGEKRPIVGHYEMHGRQVGFKVSAYDASLPLVIDPVLLYSTLFGGFLDIINAVATDAAGNVYLTGQTDGAIPLMNSIQNQLLPGTPNAFITKVNPAGTALIYSTFIGGSRSDQGRGIAVDSSGNAYIAGLTESRDFPTLNPIQPAQRGASNAFIAKLNAAGTALVYSTYLGGTSADQANAIALDSAGNAYVAGSTFSPDFPTVAPFQATSPSQKAAFVAKINAAGTALGFSTYLGGRAPLGFAASAAVGIAVDTAGSAYVTGNACSTDFPTVNPIQASNLGATCNVFVTKFTPDGSNLVYSTYLGGTGGAPFAVSAFDSGGPCLPANCGGDLSGGIALDLAGNAYVVGTAISADFPVVNPLQSAIGLGSSAFISKLNPSGSALIYSTFLGGGVAGVGIAVNAAGSAYIAGAKAYVPVLAVPVVKPIELTGCSLIAQIHPTGTALVYSTYFGGKACSATAIAVDPGGNTYVAGYLDVQGFPSVNAFQTKAVGSSISSAFLSKIGPMDAAGLALAPGAVDLSNVFLGTSATQSVTLFAAGNLPLNISSISASGDYTETNNCGTTVAPASTCTLTVTFTPSLEGVSAGSLLITSNAATPGSFSLTGFGLAPALTAPIQNAASFSYNNAAGSLASVFGVDLAASNSSVTVTGSSGTYPAATFYVAPNQINFQIPWEVAGDAEVLVKIDTVSIRLPLSATAPGIFALNSQGTGPGAIINANTGAFALASVGQSISIYCTGLGPVTGTPPADDTPASVSTPITASATVSIGGIAVTPSYAGLAPGFVGLYQVNAQVPTGVASGNAVPVFITVGGVVSNTVTIAVQ
jgi:uncharacterized protein (TIGR03437 family)